MIPSHPYTHARRPAKWKSSERRLYGEVSTRRCYAAESRFVFVRLGRFANTNMLVLSVGPKYLYNSAYHS